MEEQTPLTVFALDALGPPLADVQAALDTMEYPAEVGVQIAGAATPGQLFELDWDAAFLRWKTPEIHDVCLLVRLLPGEDEEADLSVATARRAAVGRIDTAGGLIVNDTLDRVRAVFACEFLPALLGDDDHPAWSALDAVLRALASHSGGIIYAEAEGFFDADGEPLLEARE